MDYTRINEAEFDRRYYGYLTALRRYRDAEAALEACQEGECDHRRVLRLDGKPDKRKKCPRENATYGELINSSNDLNYTHNSSLFEAIGLGEMDCG